MTVKRVLWIADYYPRPHDLTTGVWALESAVSIQKQGVGVTVLSPTPWIPRGLAFTKKLKGLSRVPPKYEIKDIPVFYPRCPHYPHRLVTKYLYNYFPVYT